MNPRDELAIEAAEDVRDHHVDDRAEHRYEQRIYGEQQ